MIRPEVLATLRRWREALVGVLTLALGLYWASGFGLLRWVGIAVAIAGAALIYTGVQRARFASSGGGLGVVSVDESQISYFGPFDGGTVSVRELTMLSLDPRGRPPHWVLSQDGQADLMIPVNAAHADGLLDAFSALPGIRTDHLLAALKDGRNEQIVIWAKRPKSLH